MVRFLNLLINEKIKLFSRIGTYVMIGLLIGIIGIMAIIVKFYGPKDNNEDWRITLEEQIVINEKSLTQAPKMFQDEIKSAISINQYRLANDLPPVSNRSLWGFALIAIQGVSIITLFTIIVGGSIVSNEFSTGTMKLLLIRPFQRWKILLAKYLIVFLFAFELLIIAFIVSLIIGAIFFGFNFSNSPHLVVINGIVEERNMVLFLFSEYGYQCVSLLMMVSFAFMISTLLRNNAAAIGVSIFLLFAGSTVVQVLIGFNIKWAKYILFANTDLSQYAQGQPLMEGMTLQFSIIVLIVYFVLFNVLSFLSFCKRDVSI